MATIGIFALERTVTPDARAEIEGITDLTQVGSNPQTLTAFRPTSGRVWSLWDMLGTFGKELVEALDALIMEQIDVSGWEYDPETHNKDPEATVAEPRRLEIDDKFIGLRKLCDDLLLDRSKVTIARMLRDARYSPLKVTNYMNHLEQLDQDVRHDLEQVCFESVPASRRTFYNAGFQGKRANVAFADAVGEMKEAGTCYALGRDTASVFHLMRAIEHALRVLVIAVGAPAQKVPLDYEEWNKLIDLVDSHWRGAVDQWGKSAEQNNARQLFKRLVADLHAFKDDVRNIVMHTRGSYDGPRALSVRNRVEAWFEVLAAKANEDMKSGELLDRSLFTS